jgi:hypothetical protein
MRRGVRFPFWYLLLVDVLGILSGCQSLRDLGRFVIRHHSALRKLWETRATHATMGLCSQARTGLMGGSIWGYPDSVDSDQGLAVVSVRAAMYCCS